MARKLVAVRLDDDTISGMENAAKNEGRPVSEVHRDALVAAFGGGSAAPPKGEIPISSESKVKRPNKATQKIQTRKTPAKKAGPAATAKPAGRAREVQPNFKQKG